MSLLNIIIPNYNGHHFLSACLDSVFKQTFSDFIVTVVDNGSCDDSLVLLHSQYPTVHTIALKENKGFAEACNIGIRSQSTPFVMLLNNDTILASDCVEHMMIEIQKAKNIFSIGPTILTMDECPLVDTTGDYYSLFGYAFCHQQGLSPTTHSSCKVFTNSACAIIYRTEHLYQTGLLDSRFFAYLEDVDLGMRARLLGFDNMHCAPAKLYHYGSGTSTTTEKYSPFKVYYSARNNILLRSKNLTTLQKVLHSPLMIAGSILKTFYFRKHNLHREYLRGIIDGCQMSKKYMHRKSSSALTTLKFELWIWYGSFLFIKQFLQRKRLHHAQLKSKK